MALQIDNVRVLFFVGFGFGITLIFVSIVRGTRGCQFSKPYAMPTPNTINQTLPTCLIHFSTRKLGYLFTYLVLSTSRKFSFYKAFWSGDSTPSYVYGSALNVVWSLRRMLGRMSKQGQHSR